MRVLVSSSYVKDTFFPPFPVNRWRHTAPSHARQHTRVYTGVEKWLTHPPIHPSPSPTAGSVHSLLTCGRNSVWYFRAQLLSLHSKTCGGVKVPECQEREMKLNTKH